MSNQYKPRPENRREFLNKLIDPYDKTVGNPNQVYSETVRPGQPEFNRAYEISQKKDDKDVNVSVGIKDIDEAVLYYFENVIKPSVIQNNIRYKVPVIYGSPERWKSVQADGFYRDAGDSAGKIQVPLIMYKRENIERNRSLGNKLDGNRVNNLILIERRYSRRNVYDNFAILTNRVPEKEYIVTFPPDYVNITYNCIIWTDFVEHMNELVEAINFASDSYWGDPTKFQFRARIDSYSNQTLLEAGNDRAVKSTFNILMNGYVIPESLNKEVASVNRLFAPAQIIFGFETAESSEQFNATQNRPARQTVAAVTANDSINVQVNQTISNVPAGSLVYINTNTSLTGTYINPTTITFPAGWLAAPAGLPTTSLSNFMFFCNGQLIEHTAITSFTEAGGVSTLVINPNNLSYSFEDTDEVIAIGKFS